MTDATHTPGPWATDGWTVYRPEKVGGQSLNLARILALPDGGVLAMIDQQAANARLIAAAPDLLAALEGCVAVLTDPIVGTIYADEPRWYADLDKAVADARAAIAKAKGE